MGERLRPQIFRDASRVLYLQNGMLRLNVQQMKAVNPPLQSCCSRML
jgi:hypothetical protein